MNDLLNKYCNKDNGLFLFSMPTGSGKTYKILEWIFKNYESYCKDGRKIFFVTNLKKNLPYRELRDKFFKPNDEFEKYVEFLDSNSECLLKGFKEAEDSMDSVFKNKNYEIFKKVKSTVESINKYKDVPDFKSYVEDQKEILLRHSEPQFRREIEKFLK